MNVSERMVDTFGHEDPCHTNGCPGMGGCRRVTAEAQRRVASGGALRFFNEDKCDETRCTCITVAITAVVKMEVAMLTRKIMDIHQPSGPQAAGRDPYCVGCWEEGGMDGAPTWPCATARVVQGWS